MTLLPWLIVAGCFFFGFLFLFHASCDKNNYYFFRRPDALSQSDWEADYSWKMLTKRDAHIL